MNNKPTLCESENYGTLSLFNALKATGAFREEQCGQLTDKILPRLEEIGAFIGFRPVIPAQHEVPPATPPIPSEVAAVARAIMLQNAKETPAGELEGFTPEQLAQHSWPAAATVATRAIEALDKVRAEKS